MNEGLLGFLQSPVGQGLLSAGLGYAANAGRGGTWNNIGRAGLAGLSGFQSGMEQQKVMEDEKRKRQFLLSIPAPDPNNKAALVTHQGVQAGAIPVSEYLKLVTPKTLEFGKVDPKDYTPESLREASTSGDYTKLVPVRKMELGPGGQVYNPWDMQAGSVMNDPQKPFMINQNGQLVPNQLVQDYELRKSKAGATNVSVNTEKSLLNEIAGGLGKNMTDAQSSARGALSTINTVGRLMDALDTGKVVAGPGTTFRQFGLQVGNMLGVAGKDGQEKLLNTRQAIQSLAQLELDAAQQMKGQGQITEAERAIIRRAASGDIDSMTTGELQLLGGVLDRAARSKIRSYNTQVEPLTSNPNAAAIAPFLTIQEPGERKSPKVLRFDSKGNPIP